MHQTELQRGKDEVWEYRQDTDQNLHAPMQFLVELEFFYHVREDL